MKNLIKTQIFNFAKKANVAPSGQLINIFKDKKDPVSLKDYSKRLRVSTMVILANEYQAGF
jgi:hypothetical protein